MLTRLVLLFAVCCALSSATVFDPYSRRYNICKNSINTLLNASSSNSSQCNLISGLYALSSKGSLSATQNVTYNAWVQNIETTIVKNSSISNQTMKLTMIAAQFNKLSLESLDIYTKIQYLNISTWGPFETVVRATNEWNFQSSLELVVPTNSKGNCKLFDKLLSACTDVTKKQALSAFIETTLKEIVANGSMHGMSQTEVIAEIYEAFQTKFFVGAQSSWMAYFGELQLDGYFAFSQFNASAVAYDRKSSSSMVLAGNGSTCPFILAMNATLSSSAYTNTQKAFIKQLVAYFTQQFTTITTFSARINLISMKFSESCDLSYSNFGTLSGITIPGFGNFFDIIIESCQMDTMPTTCGCPVPDFEMMTTTEMMSTTDMSTTMMTSTIPSTSTQCMCTCDMNM